MRLRFTWKDETKRVKRAASKGVFKSLGHAAATIRRSALGFISKSKDASRPGQPPHSRRGALKRAVLFKVDKQRETAVIGPRASIVGLSMTAHEYGGQYRGQTYPRRPLMGPALEKNAKRLPRSFRGSIIGP
jgi:hypothetical protein